MPLAGGLINHVDSHKKLRSGNYLDQEHKRRFPFRPVSLRNLSF